jgi:hypothetical protein
MGKKMSNMPNLGATGRSPVFLFVIDIYRATSRSPLRNREPGGLPEFDKTGADGR